MKQKSHARLENNTTKKNTPLSHLALRVNGLVADEMCSEGGEPPALITRSALVNTSPLNSQYIVKKKKGGLHKSLSKSVKTYRSLYIIFIYPPLTLRRRGVDGVKEP